MRHFLVILFLAITTFSYAQVDTVSTIVTNSEVERLVDKYSAKLEASITTIATSLKQPAEHIYSILVKKTFISGILSLSALSIGIVLFIIMIVLNKSFDWEVDEAVWVIPVVISVIFYYSGWYYLLC